MKLLCYNCSAPIPTDHIDLEFMVANCELCDHWFDFSDDAQPVKEETTHQTTGPLSRPIGLHLHRGESGQLMLSWRWFEPYALFHLPLSLLLFVILSGFLVQEIAGQQIQIVGGLILFALVLMYLVVWSYLGLTYFTNKTTIEVQSDKLVISHGPLPWLPAQRIVKQDVINFECRQANSLIKNNFGNRTVYELHVRFLDGTQRRLLREVTWDDYVPFVIQQIKAEWHWA